LPISADGRLLQHVLDSANFVTSVSGANFVTSISGANFVTSGCGANTVTSGCGLGFSLNLGADATSTSATSTSATTAASSKTARDGTTILIIIITIITWWTRRRWIHLRASSRSQPLLCARALLLCPNGADKHRRCLPQQVRSYSGHRGFV
jgi:hypothetical protein